MMTRRRCCCGGPPPNRTVTIGGCGSTAANGFRIPGAGFKVERLGVVYFDGVTDENGEARFYLPPSAALHNVTLTPPASRPKYKAITRTWNPSTQGNHFALTPADGYFCVCAGQDPVSGTLYVTLGDGTYVVTRGSGGFWQATPFTQSNASPVYLPPPDPESPPSCDSAQPIKFNISIGITCTLNINVSWGTGKGLIDPCSDASVYYPNPMPLPNLGGAQKNGVSISWGPVVSAAGEMDWTTGLLGFPPGLEFAISE